MSRYARKAGRRKHPNRHCCKMVAVPMPAPPPAGSPQLSRSLLDKSKVGIPQAAEKKDCGGELVYAASRIKGKTSIAISPEILKKTEGMPWHARIARIHALTSIPFADINKALASPADAGSPQSETAKKGGEIWAIAGFSFMEVDEHVKQS